MRNITKKTYEALGFVEALIAIVIAGVTSVILMRMAASSLKDAIQNERIDKMTQYAVEGVSIVRSRIANGPPLPEEFNFQSDSCYILYPDEAMTEYDFVFDFEGTMPLKISREGEGGSLIRGRVISRSVMANHEKAKVYDSVEDYNAGKSQFYRFTCMKQNDEDNPTFLNVTIAVGHMPSTGDITNDKEIKDYFYRTIIPYHGR